jgi:hypothetical protein
LLTELRHLLAAAGQRIPDQRTPEDHTRFACGKVIDRLIGFCNEFKHRVEPGAQRWRIVERVHVSEPGRLLIEFVIEEVTP